MSRSIEFPVFDADNHLYETFDAFTKYVPDSHVGLVKYVQVYGRTKIALKNTISEYLPNPTFDVVAPPGARQLEVRLRSDRSSRARPGDLETAPLPRYVPSIPAYFNPQDRLDLMNELSIDRTLMWPTLASLLEERLADDPEAAVVMVRALNRWMHEQWTFDFERRIFAIPIITLLLLDEALRELDWVIEHGARAILVRPAPVPGYKGIRRSFALPELDPFWRRVEEAGVVVGMHASDDGFQRYLNEWRARPPSACRSGTSGACSARW